MYLALLLIKLFCSIYYVAFVKFKNVISFVVILLSLSLSLALSLLIIFIIIDVIIVIIVIIIIYFITIVSINAVIVLFFSNSYHFGGGVVGPIRSQ